MNQIGLDSAEVAVYNSLPISLAVVRDGKISFVNQSFLKMFHYDSEKELYRSGIKRLLSADSYRKYQKEIAEQFDDRYMALQLKGIKKSGETIELEVGVSPITSREPEQRVITFRDITEQQKAVSFLQENSQKFESFFALSSQPQAIIQQGKLVVVNKAFLKFFSIAPQTELRGKEISDFLDPESISQFQNICKKVLSGKQAFGELEHKAYKSEGVFFDSKLTVASIETSLGKFLLLHFRDVTSEKIEKEELQSKAKEWSKIDDIVSSIGEITDLKRLMKALPERVMELTLFNCCGLYLADSKDTKLTLHHHKGFSAKIIEKISDLPFEEGVGAYIHKTQEPHCYSVGKYPSFLPFRMLFKNEGVTHIGLIPFVSNGKVLGMALLATKQAEFTLPSNHLLALLTRHGGEALSRVTIFERMKRSEQEYRSSVEKAQTILYRLSNAGTFEAINPAMEQLTGYVKREFFRASSLWLSLVHPDDKKLLLERQTKLMELQEPYTIEYRVRPKGKAAYRWIRDVLVPIQNEEGERSGFEGTLTDITGYIQKIEELSKTAEQQKIKQELSDAYEMLRNVINTMEDILILTDLEGNVLRINIAFERMLGYTFEEAAQFDFPHPWLHVEQTGKFVLWMSDLKQSSALYDFDMVWKTKQGKLLDMSICATILRSAAGEPVAVLIVGRDITERKRLSKELEERNYQVELLNRVMIAAEHSTDFNEIFSKIAFELKKHFTFDDIAINLIADPGTNTLVFAVDGITSETKGKILPLDRTISQFTLRGQQPVIIADMDEHEEYALLDSYKLGIRSQMSFPIISKGRIIGTLTIGSATANAYRGVQTKALQMVAQQLGVIIDRVQLFSKVSEDAGYIRNLLDSIDNVVYTIGTDYRILEVNRAWTDFLRAYDVPIKKEYHGLNIFDVLPDEELTLVLQKVTGDVFSGSVRYFSQEIVLHSASGEQTFQVTINPLIIDRRITGLVISHNNITELKQTASELKKYSDKLLTLNSIAMLTQTTKTISGILDKAIPMLKNTIEADAIVVFLRDEGTNDLLLTAHSDVKKELLDKMARLSLQASATGNVVKTKHPLFIQKKAYNDARLLVQAREIFKENGVEAFGVIPLISSEQVYGAMVVMYRVQNPFTEQLNQILTLAGNQLGSAVENVRLYSQLQDQVERLSVLYQLSQHLTSTLDVEQIFQFVVEHIQKILSFEELSVGWYDEKTLEITTVFEVARYEGRAQIFSKQGERKRIDAQSAEWLAIQSKRTSVARDGMLLHVPMFSKEKIIGVMSLMQSVKQADVQPQIRLLESIANLVAIALEKAKLYQETMTKTREIERRNKELDDFTYVVSHDLKEPLISIEGFTRIINTDYGESIPAEGKEYLDSIIAASGRMKHLIDDLLMLSRISRPTEAFKPVALHEIIADIRADFEFTLVRKNALLVVEDPLPVIYGNRTHIKILFQNLIGNAIKFNDKERPTVEIGFQNTENNSYLFFVRDNGIGIDKDFQEKIFVIFQRLHPREEYEGTGAGLAIVKKIVEMHKGSIWVESAPGQGSTFYFTLLK